MRSETVETALEKAMGTVLKESGDSWPRDRLPIEVQSLEWPIFDAMMAQAGFNDIMPTGEYSEKRGVLNRRAELVVADLGDCEAAR